MFHFFTFLFILYSSYFPLIPLSFSSYFPPISLLFPLFSSYSSYLTFLYLSFPSYLPLIFLSFPSYSSHFPLISLLIIRPLTLKDELISQPTSISNGIDIAYLGEWGGLISVSLYAKVGCFLCVEYAIHFFSGVLLDC